MGQNLEGVVALMPSFGSCSVRARNERFVLGVYAALGIPVVMAAGLARAHAMNAAARIATRQHPDALAWLMVDNDLIPDTPTLREAVRMAVERQVAVTPHSTNRNLTQAATIEYIASGRVTQFEDTEVGARSYVCIPPAIYAKVNGMDEGFIGWGPEDKAFIVSVTKQHAPVVELRGVRLHLWHPVDPTKRDPRMLRRNRMRLRHYIKQSPAVIRKTARAYGAWNGENEKTRRDRRAHQHA